MVVSAPVQLGEAVQIWVDAGEEEGSVWANCEVESVNARGEFYVMVTEWDGLPEDDPAYEPAYEEGPFTAADEGDEYMEEDFNPWRRPPAEVAAVEPSAKAKTAADVVPATAPYDDSAEKAAAERVSAACASLQRFGLDNDDKGRWVGLESAVDGLYRAMEDAPFRPLASDTRLLGDWELIGCSNPELAGRRGLTGLGSVREKESEPRPLSILIHLPRQPLSERSAAVGS